jgi:hypothetical protein
MVRLPRSLVRGKALRPLLNARWLDRLILALRPCRWSLFDRMAVDTDFDARARGLMGNLDFNGHRTIPCDQRADHAVPSEMIDPISMWLNPVTPDDLAPGYATLPPSSPSDRALEGVPVEPTS